MEPIQLAAQQLQALEHIQRWYEGPDLWYYLGGWAGTGKTSLAFNIAEQLVGLDNTLFAAYTGKAAFVLRSKGCLNANTNHSYLYHSKENSKERLLELKEDLLQCRQGLKADGYSEAAIGNHPTVTQLEGLIFQEQKLLRRPRFVLNPESVIKDAKLCVLDECSMITTTMANDWLSFKTKTLVLGDPFQLPPVGGEGHFTKRKPNFMLTHIHRQAQGNPILKLAEQIRNMEMPATGWYGKTRVVRRSEISKEELRDLVMGSEQLIVGKNTTRHSYNNRIRMLRGYKERYPMAGEKLVCLRNNPEQGLLNGATYNVIERVEVFEDIQRITLVIEPSGGGQQIEVDCHTHHFLGREEDLQKAWFDKDDAEEFDYGYALTCHKTQGSQFKNPVIFNESFVAGGKRWNWLYTAVTRAEESFTLVL